jgi:two-component sensor histidine kinase
VDDGKPSDVEAFTVETDVAGGPRAAARARRLIESELTGRLDESTLADVALLTTELIANGVRHGGGDSDQYLRLLLEGSRSGLHVEVTNADQTMAAIAPRRPDLGGGGGIGLQLVRRLASRWGIRDTKPSTVWFEMDC